MTVWVFVIVSTVGSSLPILQSNPRAQGHYSTKGQCTATKAQFDSEIAAGKIPYGGAECVEVKVQP